MIKIVLTVIIYFMGKKGGNNKLGKNSLILKAKCIMTGFPVSTTVRLVPFLSTHGTK